MEVANADRMLYAFCSPYPSITWRTFCIATINLIDRNALFLELFKSILGSVHIYSSAVLLTTSRNLLSCKVLRPHIEYLSLYSHENVLGYKNYLLFPTFRKSFTYFQNSVVGFVLRQILGKLHILEVLFNSQNSTVIELHSCNMIAFTPNLLEDLDCLSYISSSLALVTLVGVKFF